MSTRGVDRLQRHLGRLARGHVGRLGDEVGLVGGHLVGKVRREIARDRGLEQGALRIGGELRLPGEALVARPLPRRSPRAENIDRDLERRGGPAERFPRGLDFGGAERRAVGGLGALLVGAPNPMTVRQAIRVGRSLVLRFRERRLDRRRIVAVDRERLPARGLEAGALVHGRRERRRAVDGDAVVVPQHDELLEPQMAGEVDRLVAHPLHQAAVAGDHPGVVVDEAGMARGEGCFRDRHADRGREPLAERAGGRLDAERVAVFRMAGGLRAELPEALDLVDRHVRVAGQVEQPIEQHRPVAGREDEAVAVRPVGGLGIELEELREQDRRDVGHAHRHARMTGLRLLDRVDGQEADRVGQLVVRDCGVWSYDVHFKTTSLSVQARSARRRRSTSWRIIGVRISCMAMSSLPPGMTIEFARLMKLSSIMDSR